MAALERGFAVEEETLDTEDSMMHIDEADAAVPPVQLFVQGDGDGWSDSDNEDEAMVEEGEGEYTGKWRTVRVPTKEDPPDEGEA